MWYVVVEIEGRFQMLNTRPMVIENALRFVRRARNKGIDTREWKLAEAASGEAGE